MNATAKKVFTIDDGISAYRAKVGNGTAMVYYVRGYSDFVRKSGQINPGTLDDDLRSITLGDFSKIDLRDLAKTHTLLGSANSGFSDDDLFFRLQGENWSPEGEAKEWIRSLGLWHTSMSVGDLILRPDPEDDGRAIGYRYLVFVVAGIGFRCLGSVRLPR